MQSGYSEKTRGEETGNTNRNTWPDTMLGPQQQEEGKGGDKDSGKKRRREIRYFKTD